MSLSLLFINIRWTATDLCGFATNTCRPAAFSNYFFSWEISRSYICTLKIWNASYCTIRRSSFSRFMHSFRCSPLDTYSVMTL